MTGGDTKDDELGTDMHKWHGGIQMLYMKSCISSCDGEMGSLSVVCVASRADKCCSPP